jgi:hypothetical protein
VFLVLAVTRFAYNCCSSQSRGEHGSAGALSSALGRIDRSFRSPLDIQTDRLWPFIDLDRRDATLSFLPPPPFPSPLFSPIMFYNTEMLTKRGPLARVWMASHLSTKLTKSNLLATSIPSSVSSILGEALLPMALRLSGQLLLGVARIYSRKTKYLLDDCNETLAKVKKAFRPGAVDMDEGETGRGGAGITLGLQEGGLDEILNHNDFLGPQW